MEIDLREVNSFTAQNYLQSAIAPRPIGLVSTIDPEGNANLSPFSFFNIFSLNPPIAIFSPSRSVRTNSRKHTHENIELIPEVVIHICDYDMVEQVSLSSCNYPKGVNEFLKAGFTQIPSTLVRPPMVKEAKIKMEAKVLEIKSLGPNGGAGNLVICEILMMHVDDSILDEKDNIDPKKFEYLARLGGSWYARINPSSLFQVDKPQHMGIGIDQLPAEILNHKEFSKNNLAQLASVLEIPTKNQKKAIGDLENNLVKDNSEKNNHDLEKNKDPSKNYMDDFEKNRYDLKKNKDYFEGQSVIDQVFAESKILLDKNEIERAWELILSILEN